MDLTKVPSPCYVMEEDYGGGFAQKKSEPD